MPPASAPPGVISAEGKAQDFSAPLACPGPNMSSSRRSMSLQAAPFHVGDQDDLPGHERRRAAQSADRLSSRSEVIVANLICRSCFRDCDRPTISGVVTVRDRLCRPPQHGKANPVHRSLMCLPSRPCFKALSISAVRQLNVCAVRSLLRVYRGSTTL